VKLDECITRDLPQQRTLTTDGEVAEITSARADVKQRVRTADGEYREMATRGWAAGTIVDE